MSDAHTHAAAPADAPAHARAAASARYIVGIDLGTTHSALAYAPLDAAEGETGPPTITQLPVDQLVAPGTVEAHPLLPSAVYLPTIPERADGALDLPFAQGRRHYVVGELARARGARVPGRMVSSAKSWLCHPAVDRRAAILPAGAPRDVRRVSPVDASAAILEHLRDVWDHRFPDAPMAQQQVVLTVPASFDASARALTLEAAKTAGIDANLVLVEEPQAAFYDYHRLRGGDGRQDEPGGAPPRLVLVVDVGGGTTDLTLIEVTPGGAGAQPTLRRVAVGRHILLGGDNMDMTLARMAEQKLSLPGGAGARLDPARWGQLVQSSRVAKETLLSGEDAPPQARVLVAGRGSRLIGGSLSADLTLDEVRVALVEGFFPQVGPGDRPRRPARAGLRGLGLPYEADPGITRHVAAFLAEHGGEGGQPARPDAVLLNGGVFESPVLRARVHEVLEGLVAASGEGPQTSDGPALRLLEPGSLSAAVARGAVAYGLGRAGGERARGIVRIGGGSPHAYFVEVAGAEGERRGMCVLPRGQETGQRVRVDAQTFHLVVGQPVRFQLYATAADRGEGPGDLMDLDAALGAGGDGGDGAALSLDALPPLTMLLESREGEGKLPVYLEAELTEVGALDVRLVGRETGERWRLEFDLRGQAGGHLRGAARAVRGGTSPAAGRRGLSPKQRELASQRLNRIFGKTRRKVNPREVRTLRDDLQAAMGLKRDLWTIPMLRELWEYLLRGAKRRRRSEHHEAAWLNLAGWFLRPGFGDDLDEWRVRALWRFHEQGVQYVHEHKVWVAWWVMWRRVVGGLSTGQQRALEESLLPALRPELVPQRKRGKVQPGGRDEMMRLVASLERLDPNRKAAWGDWTLGHLEAGRHGGVAGWCMARIGARVPFSGAVHNVVEPDVAEGWLERLNRLSWKKEPGAAFAAAHIARRTDDRLRDVGLHSRTQTAQRLTKFGFEDLAPMVREVVQLEAAAEARFAGDSLPPGLVLASEE